MGWKASQVQMGYEFSKAIPTDNPRYQEYLAFKQRFGEDGNVLVIGVQDPKFFTTAHFAVYRSMLDKVKAVQGVEGILSVPTALNLIKNDTSEALVGKPLFGAGQLSQVELDSSKLLFENLLFYRGLLHNPQSGAYLAGATINREVLASKDRTRVVNEIVEAARAYTQATGIEVKLSGLPLIRTQIADRIKNEMNYFLFGSILLAAVTLILFFRSASATIMSLLVVLMGVAWAVGLMVLFGFKITLLNALIPPLIIVIGIPNCIYFLNKYHMSWEAELAGEAGVTGLSQQAISEKRKNALLNMVGKMGVVTLFCNIAAAVGFAVFALTESALLKEFGIVAGIAIMAIFFISLIFIPVVLSYLPPPNARQTRYLRNKFLENLLVKIEYWVLQRRGLVYAVTVAALLFSVVGIMRLKSVGFIVDDLPKSDKIYTDLKWFEQHFGGVMPLEIVVDGQRKNAITRNLRTIGKMDELTAYLSGFGECARPLSLVEGLKFAKQAYFDADSLSYMVPNDFDMVFLAPYLRGNGGTDSSSQLAKLTKTFLDSNKQRARISVNIADVGTVRLAALLDSFRLKADTIFNMVSLEPANADNPDGAQVAVFDSSYQISFTGSSVTYLEGSRFIINGLKESIFWAFLLIAMAMLFLFRSWRILVCSLIPNLIPLVVTAGIMGWAGVALKPSTVLVFSVALGIAIDITIRFLVNYRQELPLHHLNILSTTTATIRHTGISIIYTSLVLVAGFVIFMFSGFGGTFALGWLTSLTLLVATFTNLVFLPVIMLALLKQGKEQR